MDRERFEVERERIKRGRFRDYDSEKYYHYDEDAAYLPEEKVKKGIDILTNTARKAVDHAQNTRKQEETDNQTPQEPESDSDRSESGDNDQRPRQAEATSDTDESGNLVVGALTLFALVVAIYLWIDDGWVVGLSFGVAAILLLGVIANWIDENEDDVISTTDDPNGTSPKKAIRRIDGKQEGDRNEESGPPKKATRKINDEEQNLEGDTSGFLTEMRSEFAKGREEERHRLSNDTVDIDKIENGSTINNADSEYGNEEKTNKISLLNQLEKLKSLNDNGVISDKEFEEKKDELLSKI